MRGGNGRTGHRNTLNKKRRRRYVVQLQRDRYGKKKATRLDPSDESLNDEDRDEKL